MRARFFGGPCDGEWITIAGAIQQQRLIIMAVVGDFGALEQHRYWRYGNRLVWTQR